MPPTARPLSANKPRGRFWMNRMMKTRTAILPSTAPAKGSRNLLAMPSVKAPTSVPHRLPTPPNTTTMKRVDDVALAEIGRHVVDLRQRHAGDAGDARAEPEGERVDPRGADAHGRGHGAVLRHRAHFQADPREAQHGEQSHEHQQREDDDPQPVIGDGDAAEVEGAAHPGRIADVLVGRAEDRAHRLLQDQRQAPGGEQGFQRPAVEEADDGALDQDAGGAARP